MMEKKKKDKELFEFQEKIKELDELAQELVNELPNLPDDDELRSVFGSSLIRDPSKKVKQFS